MAELKIDGNDLVLHLSAAEHVEGMHGDLRAPLSAVTGAEVLDDAHRPVGLKSGVKIGARIPGVIEVGTIQGRNHRLFAAVHRDTPRGLRIRLEGTSYDEWVVGCADPEAVLAQLALPKAA
jgi:hypothetical protein